MSEADIEAVAEAALANAAKKTVREAAIAEANKKLEAERKAAKAAAEADAKVKAEAKALRDAAFAKFASALTAWMVETGVENPREVPDAVVNALKADAGL